MILHVDLDAFFASVEQRDNPKLQGKPVIVGGSLGLRGVVSTSSYEARKFGVHSGMPLARALKLCPNAILVPANFAKYENASEQFTEICSFFSPTVEQVSLDELYMDMAGTECLWPSLVWVAEKIQRRVNQEIGITCSIGISTQKTVAKIASGFKKPNGITEIPLGREKEFLEPLPIEKLPGCGKKMQEVLKHYGIKGIGDFAAMHPGHVEILLGVHGLSLWKVARGIDSSNVVSQTAAKSISRSTTFPFDTNDPKFLEAKLLYLTERVTRDLRERVAGGKCITVTARSDGFITHSIQRTFTAEIFTAHEIFNKARDLFYKVWDKQTKLRLIGVGISDFNQLKSQFHLFEKDGNSKWLRLEEAEDKVRNKYGFSSIFPASVLRLGNNQTAS